MKKLVYFIIVTNTILTGCASLRYTNKNSNMEQFLKERYECLKETQFKSESATVTKYGGGYSSSVTPSCSAFNACLAAKGYLKTNDGELIVPESAVITCY